MENRLIIAYVLCAIMLLVFAAIAVRYFDNRKQFKVRQSGRGKNNGDINADSVPAE